MASCESRFSLDRGLRDIIGLQSNPVDIYGALVQMVAKPALTVCVCTSWCGSLVYIPIGHALTSYYGTAKVVFQQEQWRYSNLWQMR